MRPFILLILVMSVAFLNSCKKIEDTGVEKLVTISLHSCATTVFSDNDVTLCLDSVISDSRCPSNAICIWQGTALCKFSFLKSSLTYPISLSTLAVPGSYPKDTTIAGYKIQFINLTPYPGLQPFPSPANEIKAEVLITKL